jgi:PAS domain S-box-containing protein
MGTDILKTEALLELIFCADNKETEDEIVYALLHAFMRKLNCFMAGVLKKDDLELVEKQLFPYTFKKDPTWEYIKDFTRQSAKNKTKGFCELYYNESYYYIYCLSEYGYLVIGRKSSFDNNFKNEFNFVVNFFGKVLSQSIEDERRKLTEIKLAEERRLLRTIIDNIPISIYAKDLELKKTLANVSELKRTGALVESDILGKTDFEIYPETYAKQSLVEDKSVLFDGVSILSKEKHYDNDTWALSSKLPLKNEDGQITGIVGISIDFTERRKTQEQLLVFLNLFDNISDAVQINSEEGQLLYVNKVAGERLGILPENVSNYKVTDYLVTFPTKEDWEKHVSELKTVDFLTAEGINLNQKTGIEFPVEVTVKFVDINGKGYVIAISRDISERKKTELALHESEEKYRFMTESSSDVIWHLDRNYVCDYISPADERMRGFKQSEVVGIQLWSVLKPEGIEQILQIRAKRLICEQRGESFDNIHFELEQLCKDGSWIWTEVSSTAHYNSNGDIVGFHGVNRDVTERKRAEEALRENEIKYRELVNNSPDAIAIYTNGKLVFVNNEGISLMGAKNAEELIGLSVFRFIHPDFRRKVNDQMKSAFEDGIIIPPIEEKFIRLDGSEVDVEVKAMQIILDNKLSVQLIIRDITERKQAEIHLQSSEFKYRRITENMSDIVWTSDLQFNMTFLSPSVQKMIGESIEDHINRSIHQKFTPTSVEKIYSLFAKELDKDKDPTYDRSRTLKIEVEHYRADGSIFWAEINMSILRDAIGNPVGIQGETRDISERKKVELALIESEERKASLIASMSDIVYVLDNDLILKEYHMPESSEIFIDPHPFLEKPFDAIPLPQPAKSIIKDALMSCVQNGNFTKVDYYLDMPKGRFWFELHATRLNNQHGQQSGTTCIIRDITYRRQREEIIRQQVQMQEILIKISSVYINIDLDKVESTIQSSLEELGEFVGADRAYIFDYDFVDNTTSNTYEWCSDGISPEIEKSQKVPLEYLPYFLGQHRKGEDLYIADVLALPDDGPQSIRGILEPQGIKSLISIPMMGSGKLLGFVGFDSVKEHHAYSDKEKNLLQVFAQMLVNVTERKRSETVLMLQEKKYRNIISNMNLGIIEFDKEDRIIYANQSFCNASGYEINELISMKSTAFLFDAKDSRLIENQLEKREKGISDSYELAVKNKNGEPRWWLISGAPNYNENNELIGSIGINLDITEQKTLERELEQALVTAEYAAKAKEVFLANMSHEIRTPLNVITGMVRELDKEDLSEKQRSYVAHSETATEHLLTIINNILDMSKIESGEFELDNKDFSVSAVVGNVRSILFSKVKEKNVEFKIDLSPEIEKSLIGDPGRLRQILINLLGNSIKFTEKGYVSLKVDVLKYTSEYQQLKFSVEDSGIGMSQDFMKRLFDKFSQEEGSSNRRYEGTGLGMSITKQLVQLMGGDIVVSSQKGAGTQISFELSLPIGDEAKLVKKANKVDVKSFEGLKILLVEDNDMNRFIAIQSLKQVGCIITEAENGLEAIKKIKHNTYDLILMDIQMPLMDGVEATKEIRSKYNADIPIIALTANAFKHDIDLYLSVGMNNYLIKPYKETELFEKIAMYTEIVTTETTAQRVIDKNEILYDLTQLMELSQGDTLFVNKMLIAFKGLASQTVIQLNDSFKSKDINAIHKIAHKIKPSLENLQIIKIGEKIRKLERFELETGSESELVELISDVTDVLQRVINDIELTHLN